MAKRLSEEAKESNVTPELIAEALAVYEEDKGVHQRAGMALARNQAKYETLGVSAKRIRKMWQESQMTKEELAEEIAEDTRYRKVLGLIEYDVKTGQGSFASAIGAAQVPKADHTAMTRVIEGRAYNDGYNSALHGKGAVNLHLAGSAEHASFARGENDGLRDKAIGVSVPKASKDDTPATDKPKATSREQRVSGTAPAVKPSGRKTADQKALDALAATQAKFDGEDEGLLGGAFVPPGLPN